MINWVKQTENRLVEKTSLEKLATPPEQQNGQPSLPKPAAPSGYMDNLLTRFQKTRDPDVFAELDKQFRNKLINYATKFGFHAGEAEDLVQTTFTNVIKTPSIFNGESKLDTYLISVLRNVVQNELRRKACRVKLERSTSRTIPITEVEPIHHLIEAEEIALWGERNKLVREKIEELPKTMRPVAQAMIREDKLTHKQIGQELGISTNAAKSRAFRTLSALRRLLKLVDPNT